MSTPIQTLEKKIRRRQDALRAREAETAAREAELEDLKESLQNLQRARSGIRDAIEDAMSDAPATNTTPTDVLEVALEGNTNTDPFAANGNITAEEAVTLALISMRNNLGSKGLVKMIIQTAVKVSQLDPEGVIKAGLETVRASDLTVNDVVRAALQASRNSNHIFASDIITPAVETAMERGIEAPVIVKEAFVSAARGHPSLVRASVLSVLGCAMGMGMDYRDIKSIIKAFSEEIKLAEAAEVRQVIATNLASSSKDVRSQSPNNSQTVNETQTQESKNSQEPQIIQVSQDSQSPQKPERPEVQGPHPSKKEGDYGDGVNAAVVEAMVDCALQSIDNGGPGMPACGNVMEMLAAWPREYGVSTGIVEGIRAQRAKAAAESAAEFYDDDQPQGPATKKIKINHGL